MSTTTTSALRRALDARRARRWQRQLDDAILASAKAAARREFGGGRSTVPFRALPVYRQTCKATGLRPARTVLPDLPDLIARLDELAAPLRVDEPLVAPALLANAMAEREQQHRAAVAR